jgi:class 3 adenylate cyclase/tetratricopeptide (TPR) repeat protein
MARDIGDWLEGLGLGRYTEAFTDNEIDLHALPHITEADLKDIGVALGARRKLLAAIAMLANGEAETAPAPAPDGQAAPALSGERRQVTVLFADLAGFTNISEELGAEATHGLLNRYFETVDAIVEGYGGIIDKHMGDNVMAVFGAPVAHSDDPERALRAALDIHRTMAELSEEFGRDLQAHIGIASGQVVASGTGSDAHREYTVTGSSVNLASRLQDKAEPGATLISQAVHRAVTDVAESAAMGEIEVKGFEAPVPVWRLEGLRRDTAAARRGPFVGRRAERRQFGALIQDCLETGNGQAILARGEAGIGKTRLVEEFAALAEASGFACHKGLVLDFGVGKGQDAVRALVRSLLGLVGGGNKAAREAAAERAVAAGWLEGDARVFLNDLLDLPQPLKMRALYDAMDNPTRNSGKQAAVAKLVRGSSAAQPILVAVEDIHWADALTLAHLAGIASTVADCPAVLVMTSRVEGDPLDHSWRASLRGSPLTTMDLQPLRAAEAEELAGGFVETGSAFVRDCIARAEGNPMFLEQLLRNAEEGALTEVPGSIQSLVLARMDRLEPRDKQALQAASVLGQRFAPDALRSLLEDTAYDCKALVENVLVRPEGDGYLFAHALIQEGVYSSLLQTRKRELHRRAADWFADRDPALYAGHLDRADDPAAPGAYLAAARGQASAYHYERALGSVARGLALAKDANDRWALTCFHGELLHDRGDISASMEAYRAALDLAPGDVERVPAWIGLASGMRMTDAYDDALEALDRAEAVAARQGLSLELSRIHHLRGNLYFPMGNLDGCLEQHGRALDFAREAGSPECEARAFGGLADAEYARGRMRTANGHFQQCMVRDSLEDFLGAIEAAARVNHQRAELIGYLCGHYWALETGDLPLLNEYTERAAILVKRLGARRFETDCLHYRSRGYVMDGRRAEALDLLREAVAISRETGIAYSGPRILGQLALTTDDPDERKRAIEEGESILRSGAVAHNHFWFYRDVMEAALNLEDWNSAESYAQALEDFTRAEPLPWSDFFIARSRALAAFGRGGRDAATIDELRRLHDEAERIGFMTALSEIEAALESS